MKLLNIHTGIGERLPDYETRPLSVEALSQPSTPLAPATSGDGDGCSFIEQQPSNDDLYHFTPSVARSVSRKFGSSRGALFYDGLDSPAGAYWLKSPAITKSISKSSLVTCSNTASKGLFKVCE